MDTTPTPGVDRRKSTDHDVILAVIRFCGFTAIVLASSLALSLLVAVIYTLFTAKEISPGIFTALVSPISGALGASLGYVGGVLSNARQIPQNVPTAAEAGKGIVDAATDAGGIPVKDAEPEIPAVEEDKS